MGTRHVCELCHEEGPVYPVSELSEVLFVVPHFEERHPDRLQDAIRQAAEDPA